MTNEELQERINATTVCQMMNSLGFGLGLSALALGSFVEQINYNDNSIMMDNQYRVLVPMLG